MTRDRCRRSIVTAAAALTVLLLAGCSRSPTAASPAAAAPGPSVAGTPRIIIDTDLSLWWDDATAVGMANVLQQRGEVEAVEAVR